MVQLCQLSTSYRPFRPPILLLALHSLWIVSITHQFTPITFYFAPNASFAYLPLLHLAQWLVPLILALLVCQVLLHWMCLKILEPPNLVFQLSLLEVEMILQILYLLLLEYFTSNMFCLAFWCFFHYFLYAFSKVLILLLKFLSP